MVNLNRISIAKKIFIVPAIILASMIFLSIYALNALNYQKNITKSLYQDDLKRFQNINSIQLKTKEIQENVFRELNWYQAGYDDKMIDSIANLIDKYRGDAKQHLQMLIENCTIFKKDILKVDSIFKIYEEWLYKVQEMASSDANIALIYMGNADNVFISLSNEIEKIHVSVEKQVERNYDASVKKFNLTRNIFISIVIVSISLSIILAYFFSTQLINSFKLIVLFLKEMAQGNWDLKKRIASKNSDELGQISNWIDSFLNKLQDIIKVMSSQTDMVFGSSQSLTNSSDIMSGSSGEVKVKVNNLEKSTGIANQSITDISSNVQYMSESISTIASSIDEISTTINEISKNCQKEAIITSEANTSSKNAVNVIENLGEGINEIEKIIETINDIAEQTNMLALNASIEAASAGEAGRGFTVVANEVKELAKQTSRATFEIEKQINEIQEKSSLAISSIRNVGDIIENISLISDTIASSIEEQSITVNEISFNMNISSNAAKNIANNVNKTASSIGEISSDVQVVSEKVIKTNDEVVLVRRQADDLKVFADKLLSIIQQFDV